MADMMVSAIDRRHDTAATYRAHVDLIEAQDGVSIDVAAFRAECEGICGYLRRKEVELRGGGDGNS